ncbi:hypothetical protein [Reichenbachiella sp.]|uniref:hypothetical protein n=1 Tax=Reichenbachiella sp. TaxID=2184521 RepID=UPI003B5B3849
MSEKSFSAELHARLFEACQDEMYSKSLDETVNMMCRELTKETNVHAQYFVLKTLLRDLHNGISNPWCRFNKAKKMMMRAKSKVENYDEKIRLSFSTEIEETLSSYHRD